MKKVVLLFSLFVVLCFSLSARGKQSSQMFPAGHWIYDDLTLLSTESRSTVFLEVQPVSAGEIRFYLSLIDYNKLSDSGRAVYKKVQDYLDEEEDFVKADEFNFFINMKLNPEFYYRSNTNIDLSFSPFYFEDNSLTIPIILGYSDYFTFQTDFFYGKQPHAVQSPDNFMNIPVSLPECNFYFPDVSYFSFNKTFDKWGISAHMGRKGLRIGNTSMDSIIYNNTFETDFYTQLNLFNKYLKYSMGVTQIDNTKYFYLHQLTFRIFENFNFGILEGSVLNSAFELRFLNPFMVMHQFAGWRQYDQEERAKYGESNFCDYLGLTFEYLPVRNLRIYGLYAQNEMFDPGGKITPEQLSIPNSIGGQLGAEYIIPLENDAHLKTGIEVLYTSPFLYVKHSPDWSMYRERNDIQSHVNFKSWIGSPLGPDAFSVEAKAVYETNKKWSAGFTYNFTIHGDNTVDNLFNKDKNYDKDKKMWIYYPYTRFRHGSQSEKDDAIKEACYLWMSGIPEYKHQFMLDGHYKLLDSLDFTARMAYTFIFNSRNVLDDFQQGIELDFAVTYELF